VCVGEKGGGGVCMCVYESVMMLHQMQELDVPWTAAQG